MGKENFYKKVWFWLFIGFMIFIFIPAFIEGIQEGLSNSTTITTTNVLEIKHENNNNSTKQEEKNIFLKGTNGQDFYEIVCSVGEIEKSKSQEMGETILYESANYNFSIEIEANKTTNEIAYIRMMALHASEYENFFNSVSRLEYSEAEKSEIFNWIYDNLGKETSTKLGNANFILTNGTNGKPILEVKTDYYDEYQKELINKLMN